MPATAWSVDAAAQRPFGGFARTVQAVVPDDQASAGPVVPTVIRAGGARLVLFAAIAQFGTPDDVTRDALRVEPFLPADAATGAALRAAAGQAGAR
jgi:hypothetical protein